LKRGGGGVPVGSEAVSLAGVRLSEGTVSMLEQFAISGVAMVVQSAIKNPTSAKSRALRRYLVDLGRLIDLVLVKIPS